MKKFWCLKVNDYLIYLSFVNNYSKGNSETLPQPVEVYNGYYIYSINNIYYASEHKLYTLENVSQLQKSKNKTLLFEKLNNIEKIPIYLTPSIIKQVRDNLKEIKSGIGYKTEPSTPVKINKNGDKEYIHSTPNNTTADNLKSLPRY